MTPFGSAASNTLRRKYKFLHLECRSPLSHPQNGGTTLNRKVLFINVTSLPKRTYCDSYRWDNLSSYKYCKP